MYGISPFLGIFKLNLFWFCPVVSKIFSFLLWRNYCRQLSNIYLCLHRHKQFYVWKKEFCTDLFCILTGLSSNNGSPAVTACFRDRTHDSAQEPYLSKVTNARVILIKSWWPSLKFEDTLFLRLPFIYKDTKTMLLLLQISIKILIFYYSIFTLHPSCFYA